MIVVSDTTPLSNLLQINRLGILNRLYHQVLIPPSVFDELSVLEEIGVSIEIIIKADWIKISSPKDDNMAQSLMEDLDLGEAEAIALALENKIDFLLIDEKQGRKVAEKYDLPIIGTLGTLLKAKNEGLIEMVKVEMDNLRNIGFWISDSLYQRMLILAKES